jgi:hypothetical protein
MVRLKLRGMEALDKRTQVARGLLQWRSEIITSLGGEDALSPQRMALVDLAARTKALVDHCDGYLLTLPSVINKRRKSLIPLVSQRQSLSESLARILAQLGLDRVAKPTQSLKAYIASKEAATEKETTQL